MVGSMLAAMQANKGAISIIQQQADTDDNADSDDDFYDDVIAQSALNWMEKRLTAAVKNICIVKKQYMVVHYKKQEVHTMATKTANVTARIQPNIKEQAERAILDRLGIPVSVFIDMTYRQVIMRDGVPFSLDIPDKLVTRDSITQAEFDTMVQTGLEQAKKERFCIC